MDALAILDRASPRCSFELRYLRYFIAVAEELNFRRAAERVHIDQTPLSRAIRDLEDQLGVQLFVRTPRKLHLTPAGLRLLKEARKVFIRIERAQRTARNGWAVQGAAAHRDRRRYRPAQAVRMFGSMAANRS